MQFCPLHFTTTIYAVLPVTFYNHKLYSFAYDIFQPQVMQFCLLNFTATSFASPTIVTKILVRSLWRWCFANQEIALCQLIGSLKVFEKVCAIFF
jgi:hypothetical protein